MHKNCGWIPEGAVLGRFAHRNCTWFPEGVILINILYIGLVAVSMIEEAMTQY